MDALPITLLPLTSLSGPLPDTIRTVASLGNFAESAAGLQSAPFAALLSQLSIEQPAAEPGATIDGSTFARLAATLGNEPLPLAGNTLPLQLNDMPLDSEILPLVTETATVERAATTPIALPVAAQPLPRPAPTAELTGATLARATRTTSPDIAAVTAEAATPQQLTDRVPPPQLAPATTDEIVEFELPEQFLRQQPAQATTPTPTVGPASIGPASIGPAAPLSPAAAPTAQPGSFVLQQPVADPDWGNELGQRLVWMTEQGIGRAQLRMNPPELGPVEVRISVANDEARVAFNVQHGATREALESAMPRLREMFASQGLNLADANVSEQSSGDQQQAANTQRDGADGRAGTPFANLVGDDTDPLTETPPEHAIEAQSQSIIDAYA